MRIIRVWLIALALIVTACDPSPKLGRAPDLMPNVPGAKVIEGQTITQYIASLTEGATLLQGNPALAAAIAFAEKAVTCYQKIGAVAVRVYSDLAFPLSSGLVTVVDRNAITDPANLVVCLSGGDQQVGPQTALEVCSNSYTLKKDDNEFYISYLATTREMCHAFCSDLEGCVEN